MKTAEDIIFGLGYYPSKKGTVEGHLIVNAMKEYAAQFEIPLCTHRFVPSNAYKGEMYCVLCGYHEEIDKSTGE